MRIAICVRRSFLLLAAGVIGVTRASAQSPVQSFADLQSQLKTGQQLIILTADDRKVTGRVVSLSGNQLEIRRPRWFRSQERLVFTEGSVRRIDHQDSEWNGLVIGFGIGAATMLFLADRCGENAVFCDYVAIFAPATGLLVGSSIDGAITRTLYEAPVGRRVTVHPWLQRERAGVAVAFRF